MKLLRYYVHPKRLKPPIDYIMPSVVCPSNFYSWLKKGYCKHVIIDSSVETIFLINKLKEYPLWYWKLFNKRLNYARNNEAIWVTIPDYPDDYQEGLTYEDGLDNVDKTFKNIRTYYHTSDVNWLPVIQSKFLDRQRFIESLEMMKDIDTHPKRLGIGTVCKTRDLNFIKYCLQKTREYFPDAWIHAFGVTLQAIPFARFYVNSVDSSSHVTWARWEWRDRGWDGPDISKAHEAWVKRAVEMENFPMLDFIISK